MSRRIDEEEQQMDNNLYDNSWDTYSSDDYYYQEPEYDYETLTVKKNNLLKKIDSYFENEDERWDEIYSEEYESLEEEVEALESFLDSLQSSPASIDISARNKRIKEYEQNTKEIKKATAKSNSSKKHNKSFRGAFFDKALNQIIEGRFHDADISLESAEGRLDKHDSTSFVAHGHVLNKLGDYKSAIAKFDTYLNGHPDDVSSLFGKGESYLFQGKIEEAKELFERVVELDPVHGLANDYLQGDLESIYLDNLIKDLKEEIKELTASKSEKEKNNDGSKEAKWEILSIDTAIKRRKNRINSFKKHIESKSDNKSSKKVETSKSNFSKTKPKVHKRTRESDEKYLKELYEQLDEAEDRLERGNLDIILLEELRDYGFTRGNAKSYIRNMHNEGRYVDIAKYLSKAYELPLPDNLEDLHALDVIDLNKKLQKDAEKKSKEGFVPNVDNEIEENRERIREHIDSLKKRISATQKRLDNDEPKKTSSTEIEPKTKLDDDYKKESLANASLKAEPQFNEHGKVMDNGEGFTPSTSGKFVDELIGEIVDISEELGVSRDVITKFYGSYNGDERYEGELQELRAVLANLVGLEEDTTPLATELVKLVEREKETKGTFKAVVDAYKNAGFKSQIGDGVGQAVHHLNGYNWDYEGRVDPNNLILLSNEIHDQFHELYGAGNNSIEQFLEFLYNFHPEEVQNFWDTYMSAYGNPKNMTNKLDEAKPHWNGKTKTLQDNRHYKLGYRSELDEISSKPVPEKIPYSSFFLNRMEVPVDKPYDIGDSTSKMAQLSTSDPRVLDIYDANTEASMERYRNMKDFASLKNALISRRLVETVNGLYDGHDWNEEAKSFESVEGLTREEILAELEKSHALGRKWLEDKVNWDVEVPSPSRPKSTNSDILYNMGVGKALEDLDNDAYVPEPSEIGHGLVHVINKIKKFFEDYKYIFLKKDENFENPLKDWDPEGDISPGSANERIFSALFRNSGFDNHLLAKVMNNLPIDDMEGIGMAWNPAKERERRFYREVNEEKLKDKPDTEKMAFKDIITDLKYIDGIASAGVSNETIERFFKNDGSRKSLVNPEHQKGAMGTVFHDSGNTTKFDRKLKAIVEEGGKIRVTGGEPEYILAKLLQQDADPRSWINYLNGMMVVPNAEGIAQADEIREKAKVQELRKMVGEYLKYEMENLPLYERKDFTTRNSILRRANEATTSRELASLIRDEFSEDTRKRYYWHKNSNRKSVSEESEVNDAQDKDLIKLSDPSCCKLLRQTVEKINDGIQALVKAFENGNFVVQGGSESNTTTRTLSNGTTVTTTKNDDGTVSKTVKPKYGVATTTVTKPLEYDDYGYFEASPEEDSEFKDDGLINYRKRKENLYDLWMHAEDAEIREWAKRGLDVAKEMTSAGGFQGRKANQDLLEATIGYIPKGGFTREELVEFEEKYRELKDKLDFSDAIDVGALDSVIKVFKDLTRYDTKETVDLDTFNDKRERLREALLESDPLYREWKELDEELKAWKSSATLNESKHQDRKIGELESAKRELERKGLGSTFAETDAIIDLYDEAGKEFNDGATVVDNPLFALLEKLMETRGRKLSDEQRYFISRQMMGYEVALGVNSPGVEASLHGLYNTTLLDLMKAISKGEDWSGLEAQRELYASQLDSEEGSVEKETFWELLKTIDKKEKAIDRTNITKKTKSRYEKEHKDLKELKAHLVSIVGEELAEAWTEEYYAPNEKVNPPKKYKVTESKPAYNVEGYKDWQGAVARGDVPTSYEDENWGIFSGHDDVPYPPVSDPYQKYKIIRKTALDPKIVQQIERIQKDIDKTRERIYGTDNEALKDILRDALTRKEALVKDLMVDAQVDPDTRERIRALRAEIEELEGEKGKIVSDKEKLEDDLGKKKYSMFTSPKKQKEIGEDIHNLKKEINEREEDIEGLKDEIVRKRQEIVDLLPEQSYKAPNINDLYDPTKEASQLMGRTSGVGEYDDASFIDSRWDFLKGRFDDFKGQIESMRTLVVAPDVSQETIDSYNLLIEKITRVREALQRLSKEDGFSHKRELDRLDQGFDEITTPVDVLSKDTIIEKEPLHGRLTTMAYNFRQATASINQFSGALTKLFAIVGSGNAVNDMISASSLRQTNQIMLASRRGMEEAQSLYNRIQMLVVKLPGNDTFLTNILTMLGTMDESLNAEDLEYMGGIIADYYMGAQAKGQFNNETERELRNYLMTGQTRNLTNSIIASEVESLKNLNSVKERTIALEKALHKTGMDSIAHYDSYTNTLEEFKGRFQKSFADLGDIYLGTLQGAMKLYNYLDSLTNSFLSQVTIFLAVGIMGGLALVALMAELLSISANLIESFDVMNRLINDNTKEYSKMAQALRKVIAWFGYKMGVVNADTASQVVNTNATVRGVIVEELYVKILKKGVYARLRSILTTIWDTIIKHKNAYAQYTQATAMQKWMLTQSKSVEMQRIATLMSYKHIIATKLKTLNTWIETGAVIANTKAWAKNTRERAKNMVVGKADKIKEFLSKRLKLGDKASWGTILGDITGRGINLVIDGIGKIVNFLDSPLGKVVGKVGAIVTLVVLAVRYIGQLIGWWGSFGEMFQAIGDGLRRTWEAFINSEPIQDIITAFQNLAYTIESFFNFLGSIGGGIWELLFGTGDGKPFDIVGIFLEIVGAVGKIAYLFSPLKVLVEILNSIGSTLAWLMDTWNEFMDSDEMQGLIKDFQEIRQTIGDAWKILSDAFAEVKDAFMSVFADDEELEKTKESANWLLDVLKAIAMFLRVTVIPVLKTIAIIIKGVAMVIKTVADIFSGFVGFFTNFGDYVGNFMSTITGMVDYAIKELSSIPSKVFDTIANGVTFGLYGTVSDTIDWLLGGSDTTNLNETQQLAQNYSYRSNSATHVINNNFHEGSVQADARNMSAKDVRTLFTNAFGYNNARGVNGVIN